jgi:hypothetical protein
MNLQSPCIRYSKSKEGSAIAQRCVRKCLLRKQRTTSREAETPRACSCLDPAQVAVPWFSTQSSFATETSYYSGIADACITFVAASRHIQLTLNARPSRQNS